MQEEEGQHWEEVDTWGITTTLDNHTTTWGTTRTTRTTSTSSSRALLQHLQLTATPDMTTNTPTTIITPTIITTTMASPPYTSPG